MTNNIIFDLTKEDIEESDVKTNVHEKTEAQVKREELRKILQVLADKIDRSPNASEYLRFMSGTIKDISEFSLAVEYIKAEQEYIKNKSIIPLDDKGLRDFDIETNRIIRLKLISGLIKSSGFFLLHDQIMNYVIESFYGSGLHRDTSIPNDNLKKILEDIMNPYMEQLKKVEKLL